jgi:hypothetical protein
VSAANYTERPGTLAVGAVAAEAPAKPSPRDNAERRRVTVMFSDLVGSTALSTGTDIGRRICQGERKRKQWSDYTAHWGVVLFRRQQNARGGGLVPSSTPKKTLRLQKSEPRNRANDLLRHRGHPPLSSVGRGSNWSRVPVDPSRRQCFTLELTTEVASSRRNSPS